MVSLSDKDGAWVGVGVGGGWGGWGLGWVGVGVGGGWGGWVGRWVVLFVCVWNPFEASLNVLFDSLGGGVCF